MSQLFDSLRRGRPTTIPAAPRGGGRISNGEALFASLGYTPVRRTRPDLVVAVGLLALAGAGAYAWYAWPRALPRPPHSAAPVARAVTPPTQPVATKPAGARPAETTPVEAKRAGAERSPVAPLPVPPLSPSPKAAAPTVGSSAAKPSTRSVPPAGRIAVGPPSGPVPAVAAPIPSVATPSSRASSESEDFSLAVYHQRSGDFEKALLKYRAVLEKNELNAQARNNLGLLYLDKGLIDDAVRELQRALIIEPRYARGRINLGVAWMRQDRLDAAAAEFRVALSQEPRNVDALINLALVEKANAAIERAKELLIRALGISPRNASAHYNLAVVFDHSGEVARAMEHYRSFLEYAGPDISARAPDVRARLDALTRR